MRTNVIACGIIESRIDKMLAGDTSSSLESETSMAIESETSMAIEMAYALGAIECEEHTHYVRRVNKILERNHTELMHKLRERS